MQTRFTTPVSLYDLGELKAGSLQVFIASRAEDIEEAQKLRYRVFVEEMGAKPTPEMAVQKRDFDAFDQACDHLLVVDHQAEGGYKIVGTYRLLRRDTMKKIGRFYSASEYDISAIVNYPGEIMEVGRSCVDVNYRNRAVMQLLWRGIGSYVAHFHIALMFGCASFNGTDPKQHALALSYLHHYHRAPEALCPVALKEHYVEMNLMPKESFDPKEAFGLLPPLIKGYLRLSGYIGAGAYIDHDYNTTDVSIVVKTDRVTEKYAQRYGKESPAWDGDGSN
ncbi:MAG: GNAT family N-acyltransferase [Rickettsiales bacterium]|nr:GNAT family N-acyltransferase [Rickettsiales bacterium]